MTFADWLPGLLQQPPRPVDSALLEALRALPLPHRRHETWRYTDPAPWLQRPWHDAGPLAPAPLADLDPALASALESLGALAIPQTPPGVRWQATVDPDGDAAWNPPAADLPHVLAALPELVSPLQRLTVAANTDVTTPLVLVRTPASSDPGQGGGPAWHHHRLHVHLEPGARLTLVVCDVGGPHDVAIRSVRDRVTLGAQAQLTLVRIQDLPAAAVHLSAVDITADRDAHCTDLVIPRGAGTGREDLHARIAQPGAHVDLRAVIAPRGGRLLDHHTTLEHRCADATSRQLYKSIIAAEARVVFNGRIVVQPHAQRIATQQLSRSLLLAPSARLDAKPQLEIHADDVRCTHGATVGQLDTEALFYLESRAIPPQTARRMLVQAFVADAVDSLPHEGLQRALTAWLPGHLFGVPSLSGDGGAPQE
jgi:Fe-S cluster assembly protein SufD